MLRLGYARAMGCVLATALVTSSAIAQTKGGTLTIALETDVRGFDAVKGGVLGSSGSTVSYAIHDPLIHYDPDTKTYHPMLAESWEKSADNLSWTIKLKKGVKFHNGSAFTSKDAVDHINRILDPKNKSRSRSFISAIEGATAIDAHTIVYKLKHPWTPFLSQLAALNMIGLVPSHEAVEAGTQNREPVGTGPYRFKSWAGRRPHRP